MHRISGAAARATVDPERLHEHIGGEVRLRGCIHHIRRMSGFSFVLLRTARSVIQCVHAEDVARIPIDALAPQQCVELLGLVVADARSHMGCEVRVLDARILSRPAEQASVVISQREVKASLETLLDQRPWTLRNERERAIFRVQAALGAGLRAHLEDGGFCEIHTPKIAFGSAEGGANVFALDYFGREAFLAQSPQFYKQMMVGVFERVYEIAPVFRAERHDTSRHVNEYTSVDLEMGFIDGFEDICHEEVAMLRRAFAHVGATCARELDLLGAAVPEIDAIPTLRFDEAKALLRAAGRAVDDDDLDPREEKDLCDIVRRETGSDLVFVTHYRASKRPFYAMNTPGDEAVTESFDLLFRGMEVTTGGQRIHEYAEQVAKMERLGMDVSAFESYLMAHKYGLPPHGGLGLGLERLTARLLDLPNVRQATLFPRDVHRLEP